MSWGALTTTYGYSYDAVGNLINNNGLAQTFDVANEMVAASSLSYAFDNNGNLTHSSASALPTLEPAGGSGSTWESNPPVTPSDATQRF